LSYRYQNWKKWQSERAIINALYGANRTFSDLIDLTDLSKPVLSQRLKELTRENKINVIPDVKTKRFLYHLNHENLDPIDEVFIKIHVLSKIIIAYLAKFAKDPSISDEEYVKRLGDGILMLFNIRLQSYGMTPIDIQEEWAKNIMGLEFVSSVPQLFSETRNILKYTTKNISTLELALLRPKNPKEAANQLLGHLNSIIEAVTQEQST